MLTNRTIQNLINGVSQQPPSLRLSNQAQEQINAMSRVSSGLTKRPAIELLPAWQEGADDVGGTMVPYPADPMYPQFSDINTAATVVRMSHLIGLIPVIEDILIIVNTFTGRVFLKNINTGATTSFDNSYLIGAYKSDIKFMLHLS